MHSDSVDIECLGAKDENKNHTKIENKNDTK